MISQHHNGPEGFLIQVAVSAPRPDAAQGFSLAQRLVLRLGPPSRVETLCNAIVTATAVFGLAYIVAWFFVLLDAHHNVFHMSIAQVQIFSFVWAPVMALQLLIGAVRFTVATLHVKSVEQIAKVATQEFFNTVSACVRSTVEQFMEGREDAPPEKPTIQ